MSIDQENTGSSSPFPTSCTLKTQTTPPAQAVTVSGTKLGKQEYTGKALPGRTWETAAYSERTLSMRSQSYLQQQDLVEILIPTSGLATHTYTPMWLRYTAPQRTL